MSSQRETVVLIHGLAAHPTIMRRLEYFLSENDYEVNNWGYRSITGTIPDYAGAFKTELARLDADSSIERLHIVTHSMGSIVTRSALLDFRPTKLARVVMLAPPNSGSNVARYLAGPLGSICRPLVELADDPNSFVNQLGHRDDIEVGVIAAMFDHVVPRKSTHLEYETDHIVLPAMHSMLPLKKKTARQVMHFLRHGRFQRSESQVGVSKT